MSITLALVRRNLMIYFRDRASVFLSLLSALVLLLLYLLFLGQLQVDNLAEKIPGASEDDVHGFINSWVFSGIVMITSFTTGLAAMGSFVDDRATGRFKEFRVSPITRGQLILGYQGAAFVVASLMSLVVMCVGAGTISLLNPGILTWWGLLRAAGLVILMAAAFSALSSFIMTFISSSGAYTALSTIIGTVLGFLAGAYLPIGTVSQRVADVINVLPFSPAAMLLREPLAGPARDALAGGRPEAAVALDEFYGFTLTVGQTEIHPWWVYAGLVLIAVVFTALGALRIRKAIR